MSQARSRHSTTATQRARAVRDLPEYIAPTHALNDEAQIALSSLHRLKKLDYLKQHYAAAATCVTDAAGSLNERLVLKEKRARKRAERNQDDEDANGDLEEDLEATRGQYDDMTRKMERSMRAIIDGQEAVDRTETAISWLATNAVGQSKVAESQRVRTQRSQRSQRRRDGSDEEDEDEDMDEDAPEPTMPGSTSAPAGPLPSLTEAFDERVKDSANHWDSLSAAQRYAENNHYVGFRRVVHEALTANEAGGAAPVPHHSTWFTADGKPAANLTSREINADGDASEPDSDIEVAREVRSLKCPLTLMPFTNPVTSSVCKHSFDKAAIMEMINRSKVRKGGTSGRNPTGGSLCVQCPVASCDKVITADDLSDDHYLKRKVQKTKENRDEEDGAEGDTTTMIKSSQGDGVHESVEMDEEE